MGEINAACVSHTAKRKVKTSGPILSAEDTTVAERLWLQKSAQGTDTPHSA